MIAAVPIKTKCCNSLRNCGHAPKSYLIQQRVYSDSIEEHHGTPTVFSNLITIENQPTRILQSRHRCLLALYESKQLYIYLVLVRRAHSMRRARIDLERRIPNDLC